MAKKKPPLIFYGLVLLVLAGGFYLVQERILLTRPLPAGTRVVVRTFYSLSTSDVDSSASVLDEQVYSVLDLMRQYPPQQGWKVSRDGGEVIFTRTVDGLSPADQGKSHLGEKGGYLAVIRGPAGVNGGLIRVTTIRLSSLPDEYRQQAQEGTLDLPDEISLLQILESLDEAANNE
jgi:hypothetical protein